METDISLGNERHVGNVGRRHATADMHEKPRSSLPVCADSRDGWRAGNPPADTKNIHSKKCFPPLRCAAIPTSLAGAQRRGNPAHIVRYSGLSRRCAPRKDGGRAPLRDDEATEIVILARRRAWGRPEAAGRRQMKIFHKKKSEVCEILCITLLLRPLN